MSDLLAKCDWHEDELRVELPQWPEVVTVWVDGKAMPFVPVTDPDMLGAIKCLQGLAEATGEENAKLRELVRDMWHDGMCECDERGACAECEYGYLDRLRELGIEVAE